MEENTDENALKVDSEGYNLRYMSEKNTDRSNKSSKSQVPKKVQQHVEKLGAALNDVNDTMARINIASTSEVRTHSDDLLADTQSKKVLQKQLAASEQRRLSHQRIFQNM